jgi:hypothetical protein
MVKKKAATPIHIMSLPEIGRKSIEVIMALALMSS